MKIKRRVFETNKWSGKTFKDLRIDYIKKYGIKNMWKDYCRKMNHILYRERG